MLIHDVVLALRRNWRAPDFGHRLHLLVRNVSLDLLYSGHILSAPSAVPPGSPLETHELSEGLDYRVLEKITPYFKVDPDDVMVDLGCGLGRVINWWNRMGLKNRMIGIEINPTIAKQAAKILRRYPNVEIRTGDASLEVPPEATFYFLMNSFSEKATAQFAQTLKARATNLNKVRLLYCFAQNHSRFTADGGWQKQRIECGLMARWSPLMDIRPE